MRLLLATLLLNHIKIRMGPSQPRARVYVQQMKRTL